MVIDFTYVVYLLYYSDFDITGADHKATTAFTEISQSALRLCKSSMAVKANVGRRLIWSKLGIVL